MDTTIFTQDKPREKLAQKGSGALTDLELMAIILNTGIKGCNVMALASRLVRLLDEKNQKISLEELQQIDGIGPAKATTIIAALEFTRRRFSPEGIRINTPTDVLPLLRYFSDRKQEHFFCVSLNGAQEVIASRVVSIGLVNTTLVHPREVFADPLVDRASSVIIAHNHPSGNLEPSEYDTEMTHRIKYAGQLLGIQLLDHLIFYKEKYYSFAEKGVV